MPKLGQRTGEHRTCETCGDRFYLYPSEVKRKAGRFCSMDCRSIGYLGDGNPKWRGGRTVSIHGYIYALAPDHPHATQRGYVMEHRLVMEQTIGRYLEAHEQVHHINHVRDDNRPENLQLMADIHEHRRLHGDVRDVPCGTCGETISRPRWRRARWATAYCSRTCAAVAGSVAASVKAKAETTCSRGHPWDDDNTIIKANGTRRCRRCHNDRRRGRKRR